MSSILFRNGVVHSPADPFAEALLVEDGVVAWLGAEDTADGFARRADRVVDLDGALVAPAFVDSHVHLLPTGLALEAAGQDREGDVPADLTPERHRELTDLALRAAAARGVVAVHELSLPTTDTRAGLADLLARTADASSGLPLVVGYRGELCETTSDVQEVLDAVPGLTGLAGIGVDGTFRARTAALTSPYADDPEGGTGLLRLGAEEVTNHVLAATRAGVQAGFHVVGDRALREVLLGLEAAADLEGLAAVRARGHRLEHVPLVGAPALAALVLLGLRVSVQPAYDTRWGGPDGVYAERLGATRAADTTPLADLAGAGVPLGLGSSAPTTPIDPWAAVAGALHLHSVDQRVSARAAFRAHTRGGWRLANLDHTGAGELRVGAPAHLAVWRAAHLAVEGPQRPGTSWSTDARAGTPLLPALGADEPAPTCHMTLRDGVVLHEQW